MDNFEEKPFSLTLKPKLVVVHNYDVNSRKQPCHQALRTNYQSCEQMNKNSKIQFLNKFKT